MFSTRTRWDATANPLAEAIARRRASGLALLDLTESNPTRAGLGFPREALLAALADDRAAVYEPHPLGLERARAAIAGYYASRGLEALPDRTVVTSSTSEAYAYLFKLLCDPGDEVLVPEPSYPLFGYLAGLESVVPRGYPLRYDGDWHVDREALRQAVGPRTRAVIAVSPNNPTGSYLKRDELAFLSNLCAERGLALLCDEVFADFPLEALPDRAGGVLEQHAALAFALSGASKVAALPQLKIGWLVASGPEALVAQAMERLEIVADCYLSPSTPAQLALPAILARRDLAQEPLRQRLRENLSTLDALRTSSSAWQRLRVEGGWSAVLRIPAKRSEQDWVVRLVEEEGVVVHPGFFFDFPSPAFVAVSLIVPPAEFREGLGRIVRRFDEG
ncbi:MAG TPA: pyridoxal phosphate-dependent aminotransferase [Myxococcales bacterium]|jgi:hypothetical protein